jgi:uncharacterized protein (AIM24 family)
VKSSLFGAHLETTTSGERFALQNERLLRVTLGPEVMARQGAMVAYQGGVQFEFQGSGGVGRFLKKALTGEGLPLMRCSGAGELFLARDAREIFLIQLEGESLTVNGDNLLAFDSTVEWDIRRVEGVSVLAGGLFNTVLSGTGEVAITSFGTPVVLQTDVPTFADAQSAIAWSSGLQTSVQRTMKLGALVGRGSGEAVQLAFSGQGFVVVQASEGPSVPPHNHGG